ncbi:aquaporin Z [Ciceribacter sp. RN22]|uniref:aquaporin Z n=1 Tax=Ciceribacter sp. RN22 TaxID=2954932 RepID=UPI002093AF62|nr:aquaporin Z [Ciceribacter sp. RN22]MCO6180793.1 aquaporin Z [Ciceribacter sp. RN22]
MRKLFAEFVGTFTLVFTGCGSAVLAAGFPELGIGFQGVAIAFGLSVLTMAYALGPISGGHFNPAVTFGLMLAGRFDGRRLPGYWLAQVAGACLAGALLYVVASGQADFEAGAFASNGYGEGSPGGFDWIAVALCEVVLTALFVLVIIGATSPHASAGFGPLAIGLALTLFHLVSIPVSNTSLNPARSTATVLFADSTLPAMQLWMFWVAPLLGATLAGLVWNLAFRED